MAASKKLYSGYTEVTTNQLTDQVPVLQNGNKKTTLQKVYNLFANTLGNLFQPKQSLTIVNINAQETTSVSNANCILSITNIPSGTGNKQITMDVDGTLNNSDILQFTVKYAGHSIDFRSYNILNGILTLYINLHTNPTEPVIISMNKIN